MWNYQMIHQHVLSEPGSNIFEQMLGDWNGFLKLSFIPENWIKDYVSRAAVETLVVDEFNIL